MNNNDQADQSIHVRLATLVGKQGKPSVIVSKNYEIFIGNESEETATYQACEIFGFGTGSFEFKLVHGEFVSQADWRGGSMPTSNMYLWTRSSFPSVSLCTGVLFNMA